MLGAVEHAPARSPPLGAPSAPQRRYDMGNRDRPRKEPKKPKKPKPAPST
jgi:hypothetical protein